MTSAADQEADQKSLELNNGAADSADSPYLQNTQIGVLFPFNESPFAINIAVSPRERSEHD